jgi:formate dehydrogenase maturation protein FdhE
MKRGGAKKTPEQKVEDIVKFYEENMDRVSNMKTLECAKLLPNKHFRKNKLKEILSEITGPASPAVYESLVKLASLEKKCIKEGILYMDDLKDEFEPISKRKVGVILKRARRFFFIASNCRQKVWKKCTVAPTYWEDVSGDAWNKILDDFGLKNDWDNYMKSINKC